MSIEQTTIESNTPPAIGQAWLGQGGIYAGLVRGRDGAPDCHVIVGPELSPSNWSDANSAAAEVSIEGHNDFTLPFRAEQALLFANVPELFEKSWYWSCEQRASSSDYAWVQTVVTGFQYNVPKSHQNRARAARRFEIFKNSAQA